MRINFGARKQKQIVRCDNCRKVINPEPIDTAYTVKGGKKLGVTYFKCKHCKQVYLISFSDSKTKDYIKQMQNLTKAYKVMISAAHKKGNQQLIDKYLNEYETKRDKLKNTALTYESGLKNQYSDEIINYL